MHCRDLFMKKYTYVSHIMCDCVCVCLFAGRPFPHMSMIQSNFSSVWRSPQQDFSRSLCSCCCPPLLSCSFLVPLGLLSHYLSTSLVVFLCFLFPPLVRTALLPVVCFPPSLLCARTTSAFFF